MSLSDSEKRKYPPQEEYFANFPEPVENQELQALPEQFDALFELEKILRRIEKTEPNFFRSVSFEEAENMALSGVAKEAYTQKRVAELKAQFIDTESKLRRGVYTLLQSPEIRQRLDELFGENESLSTPEETKQKSTELLKGFYTLYEKKLTAEREKRDNLTQEQDAAIKKEIAWDVTAISIPNDAERSSKTENWDKKRLKLFYARRKEWDILIEKLRLLPGAHQKALQAYLSAPNSDTALSLINMYKSLEGVHISGNFQNLELSYTAFDAVDFESDLQEINNLLEEYQAQGLLPEQLSIVETKPKIEIQEATTAEKAREILGREYFVGKEEVQRVFELSSAEMADIPGIPFTEAELREAKELGQTLILRIDKDKDGQNLTGARLNEILASKRPQEEKLLFDTRGYQTEDYFRQDTIVLEWKLVSGDPIANSTSKDYAAQTKTLRDALKAQGALTLEEEQECTDALLDQLAALAKQNTTWQQAAEQLVNLKVNQNHRPSSVEEFYDATILLIAHNRRILEDIYTWTRSRASSGFLVILGRSARNGMLVARCQPRDRSTDVGVSLSRSCGRGQGRSLVP